MSDIEGRLNSQSDMYGQDDQSSDKTTKETSADASSGVESTRISPDLTVFELFDEDLGQLDDERKIQEDLFNQVEDASSMEAKMEKVPDEPTPSLAEEADSPACESLGKYLRRHREAAGITIDQLVSTTKIKGRIISALEEDRYEDTPHAPIVRGFLKILASEIGLSANDLLSRFHSTVMKEKENAGFAFPEWDAKNMKSHRVLWARIPVVSLFLLVLGAGYFLYVGGWKLGLDKVIRSPGKKVVDTVPRKVRRLVVPKATEAKDAAINRSKMDRNLQGGSPPYSYARAASMNLAETKKVVDNSKVKVTLKTKTVPSKLPLVLSIMAKGDTWLRVIVDGNQRDEIFLLEGESRRWSGNKTFVLTVGNATSTVVELNGSSISLPKTKSNLVRDFLISKNDLP